MLTERAFIVVIIALVVLGLFALALVFGRSLRVSFGVDDGVQINAPLASRLADDIGQTEVVAKQAPPPLH